MTESDLLTATLQHPAGFAVDLFGGLLTARRLENGTFVVESEGEPHATGTTPNTGWSKSFDTAREAASFFTQTRHSMQLGYDIEAKLMLMHAKPSDYAETQTWTDGTPPGGIIKWALDGAPALTGVEEPADGALFTSEGWTVINRVWRRRTDGGYEYCEPESTP